MEVDLQLLELLQHKVAMALLQFFQEQQQSLQQEVEGVENLILLPQMRVELVDQEEALPPAVQEH